MSRKKQPDLEFPREPLEDDVLLDTRRAAKFLSVHPGTMKDWRVRPRPGVRTPDFIRVGGMIRYSLRDLESYLAEGRVSPRRH